MVYSKPTTRGERWCVQCGLVVAEATVDTGPEWRSFDRERRVRAAPLRLVVKTDVAVKAEHGTRWRRLAKFHRWRFTALSGDFPQLEAS